MRQLYLSELGILRVTLFLILTLFLGFAHSAPKTSVTEPKTVLVLGDSLSAEYGLTRGAGWVALLQHRLQEKNLDVKVVNASISGDTTGGGLDRIAPLLQKHRPNVVIVELGANDGLRGLPLTTAQSNIAAIISDVRAAHANVLLIGMQIPPNYGADYTEQFNTMYKKIAAQQKVALVPFLLEGIADKPEFFQDDQLHPKALAHPKIVDNVWPYLLPLISK